ncbi:dephospho-CoA kinase [Pedobacter psychrotolerans]|uniref:Dephospho-CoA kinase n=1 Tax=Pedobacter psychrotolerans TaxID=1843235 RepID=A0A4V6NMY9_9SPHI|nr:dephospho-CoA kinase [Pedobacter psychrotolerans]TCO20710.1 dephospho-CoA kinase [Pedobacter psychrotolerans]GGE67491.1 dephospho-CoA kinase [Pedobacter psychrotolerans]
MYKVGITGGIGSGKTTVCKVFEVLGIPIFYADTVAKEIMVSDQLLVEGIISTFGEESYTLEGELNKKHLASIVFNNEAELAKLNNLVHPAVFRAFEGWVKQVDQKVPYILKEAALLFESDSYKMCDTSILVTAPYDLKLARVMQRDQFSADQVKARMDKQMSDEEKAKMADHFIVNDEKNSIIEQVLTLHKQFLVAAKAY